MDGWLTLTEAGKQAGVNPRTLRRWIKEKRLTARLAPGPYGSTYYVEASALEAARKPATPAATAVDGEALAKILTAMQALHAEVASLREEVQAMRALPAPAENGQHQPFSEASQPRPRPWWQFWK